MSAVMWFAVVLAVLLAPSVVLGGVIAFRLRRGLPVGQRWQDLARGIVKESAVATLLILAGMCIGHVLAGGRA